MGLPQDLFLTTGNWRTAADWSTGAVPTALQDTYIGADPTDPVTATSNKNVTVNSIGTASGSTLVIGSDSTLTATNGTLLSPSTPTTFFQNNVGTVQVDVGSTLAIGNTFENEGALDLGYSANGSGEGYLKLSGDVTLDGSGTVNLGSAGNKTYSDAKISGGGLTNVNNAIEGGGFIYVTKFDNQSQGVVDASHATGHSLSINANIFTNEGAINVEKLAHLDLGADGATNSLTNTGSINIGWDGANAQTDAVLAIRGDMTVSGSGAITMKGAGAALTSDGKGPATLTNDSTIEAFASGQIGDVGLAGAGVNDLTFDNAGTTLADGAGVTLTLNTGAANMISDRGGLLEAEDGATLAIDSNVATGERRFEHSPSGGTIEAAAGGAVTLSSSVFNGLTAAQTAAGQVVVEAGGVFKVLTGGSVLVPLDIYGASGGKAGGVFDDVSGVLNGPVEFESAGATLELHRNAALVNVIGSGGTFDLSTAAVAVTGGSETFNLETAVVSVTGGSNLFDFAAKFGKDVINGFASSDTIEFGTSDFASWSVLQPHIAQSGANTTITLDANDVITLDNVKASSLTASEFKFV